MGCCCSKARKHYDTSAHRNLIEMVFHFGGHTFTRLEKGKIELLRNWRNADWIKPFMHYTEHITTKMQQEWFNSIDNCNNWYFIIEKDGIPIGSVYLREMKMKEGVTEPGILMTTNDEALTVSIGTSMLFLGIIGLRFFGLKSFISRQHKNHSKTLSNQFHVGARIIGEFGKESVFTEVTSKRFEAKADKVLHALKTVTGEDHGNVKIITDSRKDDVELIQFLTNRVKTLPKRHASQFQIEYL